MKKKLLVLSIGSTVALATVASVFLASKGGNLFSANSADDYWTISFDALDLVGELDTEYRDGNQILKTDQNKNDVTFHYEDCYAREFNGTNYLEVNPGGYVANTTEIRGMASLTFYLFGEFKIEWGFVKDGDEVQYESSHQVYKGSDVYTFDFEGTHPNYFKITNVDTIHRQLTDFVARMDKKCEATNSPYIFDEGLKYYKHDTYAECLGFSGESKSSLTIPAEVGGLPVTKIGDEAFKGDETIETLTLSNGLIDIGTQAFDDCSNIAAISIPKSVEVIRRSAFDGTSGCTSLTFESGGTQGLSLGTAAFEGNGHIGELILPSRVTSISTDGYVFNAMIKVSNYALNDDNHPENILSIEDGVLFADRGEYDHYKKTLISYPVANERTVYTIPSDCTRIETCNGLRNATRIKKLIIDNDVELYFGSYSAASMVSLEEIEFKESSHNVYFYWYAFNYAPELRSILVPDNLVVLDYGLYSVNQAGLHVYLEGDEIPASWSSSWCYTDVENGRVKVYYHDEVEPETIEDKLTRWHYVSEVPTPYAINVEFDCFRDDIGEGYAFYLLGVDSWTPSVANRGTYVNGSHYWRVTLVMVPNTAYEFKGAISEWENPINTVYEEGSNRQWTPDRFSNNYTVDWHY